MREEDIGILLSIITVDGSILSDIREPYLTSLFSFRTKTFHFWLRYTASRNQTQKGFPWQVLKFFHSVRSAHVKLPDKVLLRAPFIFIQNYCLRWCCFISGKFGSKKIYLNEQIEATRWKGRETRINMGVDSTWSVKSPTDHSQTCLLPNNRKFESISKASTRLLHHPWKLKNFWNCTEFFSTLLLFGFLIMVCHFWTKLHTNPSNTIIRSNDEELLSRSTTFPHSPPSQHTKCSSVPGPHIPYVA